MYRDKYPSNNSFRGGYGPRGGRSFGDSNIDQMKPCEDKVNFNKNFYSPTVTISIKDAEELIKSSEMKLIGNDIPLPVNDFSSLGFPTEVVKYFESKGYTRPTPIQAQGWPMALQGKDVVGIADTGSGKTISFVLPALIHAKDQIPLRQDDGPIVSILAPTRELVTQIEEVVREYCPFFDLRSTSIYGGVSVVPQKKILKRGVEIVVATPEG
jgi:ATP-dependent RNA helicase DDX5/DBP2